ncbi:GNAT family N-acetyltransferase [Jiangella rhizosphaerae]|uniref:N-acetyltransferase n=1 Tax=Jiangella rhizosphaerae TaxID=2293569 RepID=A0A418KVE8_9ACTN|nr:GNAT family N-acetyltransferase [Jiangella rhizosphaerae]RIQ34015.1 N-acetyltransferase [Jiangella rhizosphaerae]
MTDQRFEVQNRAEESRYVLIDHDATSPADQIIGEEDYVDVDTPGGIQRVLYHTGVSEDYSGQGLASLLVRTVVEDVIAHHYAIVPVCPYVAAWLPKHPEYNDHIVRPRPHHLRAVAARQK